MAVMNMDNWLEFGLTMAGIIVAVLTATVFATRQNKKILIQNLRIETYKEMWRAVEDVNESLMNLSAYINLQLNFLENTVNSQPNFQETQPDFDFRRRQAINNYSKEFDGRAAEVTKTGLDFHRLWEQKEPLMYKLSVAFQTYQNEFNALRDRIQFPSQSRLHLDLDNFNETKLILEDENQKIIEMAVRQLVYGMDLARLVQEELIAGYFNYKPIPRATNAEVGYELTRDGLHPVANHTTARQSTGWFKKRLRR